jgi:hypothetical protein
MTQENNQQTTVTKELDAVEVAQAAQTGNNNPEDVAAAFFALEYPRFKAMLQTLSQNELVRLALNLAGNEFVPEANKLKTEKEKTAYYLGNQMIFNRSIMLLTYEMQKAEEAARLEEQSKQEENTNKPEGETNG